MKVILLQDVDNLGKAGDLKDVADGYARNYLLPGRMAAGATPALLANHQQRIAAEKRNVTLTFRARVGRQGRLYGSITSQDIAAGLRATEGITIDRRLIDLPDPIRAVGTYTVPVKVATKLQPKITVNVIDEAGSEATQNAVSAEAK